MTKAAKFILKTIRRWLLSHSTPGVRVRPGSSLHTCNSRSDFLFRADFHILMKLNSIFWNSYPLCSHSSHHLCFYCIALESLHSTLALAGSKDGSVHIHCITNVSISSSTNFFEVLKVDTLNCNNVLSYTRAIGCSLNLVLCLEEVVFQCHILDVWNGKGIVQHWSRCLWSKLLSN
ncbi:unnamed protein product [Cuscuta epithymum]|uniref:Uncharacterized protein n=1 Tax=Cuscuta epithymum TaxID=186058 RepID=A0AAV0DLZ6_9ASTE|nr:unnamed protein product [Cuscuta epithymum]